MFIVTVKFITITRLWNWLVVISVTVFSVLVYIGFIFLYDFVPMTWSYKTLAMVQNASVFYLCVMLCCFLVLLLDGAVHIFSELFFPKLPTVLYQAVAKGISAVEATENGTFLSPQTLNT
jgi:hypothetical protein